MHKKLVLIVMSFLIIGILVACGASNEPTNSSAENSNAKKSTENKTEEKKLTVWHVETGENITALENAAKRFEEKHEGVTVEVVQVESDPYKTNLVVAMSGGNPPDVFHSWGGGWLKQFTDANQVIELTDKIDINNYVPAALNAATFDGKIFGAPLGLSGVPVYYNKEIFEKYKLTPPTTYDDLLTIIDTLKENNIIPFALANQSKWPGAFYLMYVADRLAGNELFESAFAREGRGFDDPVYVRAGEMIQELVEKKAFPNGFNGLNYNSGQSRQLMYTEQAAMIMQTTAFISSLRTEGPEDFEKKLDIFNFPSIEGGEGNSGNVVGGVSPVFSAATKSKHPDLAVELVKELTSVETAQAAVDGGALIPAVQGVTINDEFIQKVNDFMNEATNIQSFYDQTLPPELGQLHKDTTQSIFGLEMTPQEAAEAMEKKAKELLE